MCSRFTLFLVSKEIAAFLYLGCLINVLLKFKICSTLPFETAHPMAIMFLVFIKYFSVSLGIKRRKERWGMGGVFFFVSRSARLAAVTCPERWPHPEPANCLYAVSFTIHVLHVRCLLLHSSYTSQKTGYVVELNLHCKTTYCINFANSILFCEIRRDMCLSYPWRAPSSGCIPKGCEELPRIRAFSFYNIQRSFQKIDK